MELPTQLLAPLFGGAILGLSASLLLFASGRIAGTGSILGGLLYPGTVDRMWRVSFLSGLCATGALLTLLAPAHFAATVPRGGGVVILSGLLVGIGSRLCGGCTLGHGLCGVSRLSKRSLVATATLLLSGAITVLLSKIFWERLL